MLNNLAIIDLETTGMKAGRDRITEIGIVLVDNNKVVKTWHHLVNPERGVNPYILNMTGINPYELSRAPTFAQLSEEIWQYLENRILVAHNVRFDYGFLKAEFNNLDTSFNAPHFCTVQLSRKLYPGLKGHGLDKIISRFGFAISNRHRALDDALIVWEFLKVMHQTKKSELESSIEKLIKTPGLPTGVEESTLQNLPECPGVYLFYDKNDMLLYVGKSINIKQRVKSHFYDDLRNPKELKIKQQVTKIDSRITAGELEALLLESQLIKELQPVYNHQLRRNKVLHTLMIKDDGNGYNALTYKASKDFNADELIDKVALFRTKRLMQKELEAVIEKHALCKKLMGLEKTSSSCFGYRLRNCMGACVGKEPVVSYNLRVAKAFKDLDIPSWPFDGEIIIREVNTVTGDESAMVFENWCYRGKALAGHHKKLQFDYDTYRIVRLYLKQHPSQVITPPTKNN